MGRRGYSSIGLPDELIKEVDKIVKDKKRGYQSRSEFIKEATRRLLDNMKKIRPK